MNGMDESANTATGGGENIDTRAFEKLQEGINHYRKKKLGHGAEGI